MSKRILKKLSKKAKTLLVQCAGYSEKYFMAADREDATMCGVLKGTTMFWSQSSWEYNEWDCEDAFSVLREFIFWECSEFDSETGDILGSPKFKSRGEAIRMAKQYVLRSQP
ncbi:hypothetical protein HN263_15940 [Acinetobacter baumannii]|uniref:hypothetical protein n=1 Tax=Acinetobacter baumannii TaxID=470 RepID=UPI00189BCF07|nr:hypothetical protein [Acinetobacter baumannii]MBF6756619.1 hypothetical protein [Acinetobacter baumannii]